LISACSQLIHQLYIFFMTCPWLFYNLFTIYLLLVHDVTCWWLVQKLFINLFMTCSWLVYALCTTWSCKGHRTIYNPTVERVLPPFISPVASLFLRPWNCTSLHMARNTELMFLVAWLPCKPKELRYLSLVWDNCDISELK